MAANPDSPPPQKSTPRRIFSALDALIPLAFVAALASFAGAIVWQATISCHDGSNGCDVAVFNVGSAIAFFGPIIATVVAAGATLGAAARGEARGRWHLYSIGAVVIVSAIGLFIAVAASG